MSRREAKRAAVIDEIKRTARTLMSEKGTTGLSIRAIARQMGLTSAALYYYFDSLNDLLIALIVDAYTDMGQTLQSVVQQPEAVTYRQQVLALANAYRDWAMAHPVDFQLIYGNPIPGFEPSPHVTEPPARRSFALLASLIAGAMDTGQMDVPTAYTNLPSALVQPLNELQQYDGHDLPPVALYLAASVWAQMHGRVMLELFNQIQPVIGDAGAFYHHELQIMLQHIGMKEE